ncbi:uncharacterized protein LOC126857312 [Cataglyphis hispanica]|uniref:uncharacterized protein LOC126857312 n=1 Tax=Cataglyphis hispanica TaxID=1086592 RepID=UPI00218047E0|nr:uncharacterized protein LOC126857312 [Cataglyphis hispanica]
MCAMSEIKDDPREVLVLLNSLGFVGITAVQLKAFMKDLKIYRKIKERERQQRKEEIKTKIISKQQALIKEAHGHQNTDYSVINIVPSESSNSFDDESLIKVKIKCIPKEDIQKYIKANVIKSDEKLSTIKYHKEDAQVVESDKPCCKQNYFNTKPSIIKCSKSESRQNASKSSAKDSYLMEECKLNLRLENQVKPVFDQSICKPRSDYVSESESKSIASDPTANVRTQSTLSTRSSINSRHKSFIRPWSLQPQAQKVINKKCDPVALYQKYQQEWKQISFPGVAKHSKVRWAVREKMLGTDPHPVPLLKKSTSISILKKK